MSMYFQHKSYVCFSLTVEVLRVQGPNTVEEKDPIFERGSSTTYSSFRKASYTKPWSNKGRRVWSLLLHTSLCVY